MEIKYLIGGESVGLVQKLNEGWLVCSSYESEGETVFDTDEPYVCVAQLYDNPPVMKYETKIADLKKTIVELDNKRDELTRSIQSDEQQMRDRIAKITRYKGLERLEDYIESKFTHLVVLNDYDGHPPYIIEVKDAKCEHDSYKKKLLTLWGDSKGDLQWRIGRYADGSATNPSLDGEPVVMVQSHEEGLEVLKKYILGLVEKKCVKDWILTTAEKYKIVIPAEYLSFIKESKVKQARDFVQRTENTLKGAQAELDALLK